MTLRIFIKPFIKVPIKATRVSFSVQIGEDSVIIGFF